MQQTESFITAFSSYCLRTAIKQLSQSKPYANRSLNGYGIREIVNNFFDSFLTNRNQYAAINNTNPSLNSINIGVSRGSNLGPLNSFLLYVNDIPYNVDCTRLFADDTCLLMVALSINTL